MKNLVYGLDIKSLMKARKKCCIGVRRPAVRTRKSVAHKCITHSTTKQKAFVLEKGQGRDALDGFSHLALQI